MRIKTVLLFALIGSASALMAQEGKGALQVFGGEMTERAEARLLFWNSAKNTAAGEFVITYGQPEWKVEYNKSENFDKMTKGKVWRLGKNFWTMLDTNLPLRIGGEQVAPGQYYLGAKRSADGATWKLCFIDPTTARAARLDASGINNAEIAFTAPLKFSQSESSREKLDISLIKAGSKLNRAQLVIAWGGFALKTTVVARLRK